MAGIREEVLKGNVNISYCKDCAVCKGTSFVKCPDCNGTGEIDYYKVASEKEIEEEVEPEVQKKIKFYREKYQKKQQRMNSSGVSQKGDAFALEKAKNELDSREYKLREMLTEKVRNKKVPCPCCSNGEILCSAHKYDKVKYKEK